MHEPEEQEKRRQALLNGIRQNHSYKEMAAKLGIRQGHLIRDLKAMRRNGDPDLLEAQRIGKARTKEEKRLLSKRQEDRFQNMTGMSLKEKSFQNMIHFHKHELMNILRSGDREAAIRDLPKSTRRTLIHNGILTKRNKPEITQQAREQLL